MISFFHVNKRLLWGILLISTFIFLSVNAYAYEYNGSKRIKAQDKNEIALVPLQDRSNAQSVLCEEKNIPPSPEYDEAYGVVTDANDRTFDFYPALNNDSKGTIVFFHGGGERREPGRGQDSLTGELEYLRQWYNIADVNYSYTISENQPLNYQSIPENRFPQAILDAKQAVNYIADTYDDRIYVMGVSFGGYLANMINVTQPAGTFVTGDTYPGTNIIAAASMFGIADWTRTNASSSGGINYYENNIAGINYDDELVLLPSSGTPDAFAWNFFGDAPNDLSQGIVDDANPIMHIGDNAESVSPMFLAHGKKDIIVPYRHSVWLQEELSLYDVPYLFNFENQDIVTTDTIRNSFENAGHYYPAAGLFRATFFLDEIDSFFSEFDPCNDEQVGGAADFNLAIFKSVAATPAVVNGAPYPNTYSITVINDSLVPATSFAITDTLPSGLRLIAGSFGYSQSQNTGGGSWQCSTANGLLGPVTCDFAGALAPGASVTIPLVFTEYTGTDTSPVNTATVENTDTSIVEVDTSDNTASALIPDNVDPDPEVCTSSVDRLWYVADGDFNVTGVHTTGTSVPYPGIYFDIETANQKNPQGPLGIASNFILDNFIIGREIQSSNIPFCERDLRLRIMAPGEDPNDITPSNYVDIRPFGNTCKYTGNTNLFFPGQLQFSLPYPVVFEPGSLDEFTFLLYAEDGQDGNGNDYQASGLDFEFVHKFSGIRFDYEYQNCN